MLPIESIFVSFFVASIWGITPIINKYSLGYINFKTVLLLLGISYFTSLLVYSSYHYKEIHKTIISIPPKILCLNIFSGFILLFLANVLFYSLLETNESYIIIGLVSTAPVITLLFSYLFLKERISYCGGIGVFFIVAGCLLLCNAK
jgi:uncharacterized membrane protein